MIVYLDDGTAAFDSRLKPLAVTGGKSLTHPANPRDSFGGGRSGIARNCNAGIDTTSSIFAPTNFNEFGINTENMTKPMYFYASLAQAERESVYSDEYEECTGFNIYNNCIGYGTKEYWTSWYWAFYRGAISNSTSGKGYYVPIAGSKATVGLVNTQEPHYANDGYGGSYWDGTYDSVPAYTTYATNSANFYGNRDDGYWALILPWQVGMTNNTSDGTALYSSVNVSTNSYVTFGGDAGSTIYYNLDKANTVTYPKIMLFAADNSSDNIYTTLAGTSPNREYTIRYEGYASNVTIGSVNIKWEMTFYENNPYIIDVKFDNDQVSLNGSPIFAIGGRTTYNSGGVQSGSSPFSIMPIRLQPLSVSVIRAGWVPVATGCHWSYSKDSQFLGINAGGGSGSDGIWPYANETLNLSSNTLITADAARYD
jgi:hypothetical protein